MEDSHRRILDRWRRLRWQGWWGDHVDARFELGRRASSLHDQTVLDLGCGPGVLLAEVPSTSRRIGVDWAMDRLAMAHAQMPDALLIRADFGHLPFRDGVFDTVIMAGVYEIPPDKRPFMKAVGQILADDGQILATTPNGEHWHFWYDYGSRYHSATDVEETLADFRQVVVEGYNPIPSIDWILPKALLQHVPHQWTKFFYVPTRVLAWIPGLTRLFRRFMPVAGLRARSKSLFIVARRMQPGTSGRRVVSG